MKTFLNYQEVIEGSENVKLIVSMIIILWLLMLERTNDTDLLLITSLKHIVKFNSQYNRR